VNPLQYFESNQAKIIADLKAIVSIESPTYDLAGIAQVADWIEAQFKVFGSVKRRKTVNGPMLTLNRSRRGAKKVLVLCHYDTVHPRGAFGWKLDGDKAFGPGIYDMKGNIVQLLWALRAAAELGLKLPSLEVLLTPDEEVGSQASRAEIEAAAKRNEGVLVLEAPMPNGDLKVARKGVGQYKLEAIGKPAHQGVEPQKGINAIVELAHQIPKIVAMQDWDKGTTLGPNVIEGGTVSNVVAERAAVLVDLRAWTTGEARRIDRGLKALKPVLKGARLELTGGLNRPPMEPTKASMKLFEMAQRVGAEVGLRLGAGRVGGGSDGNLTAALGVPTLDGLGLFGADAHQKTEHIYLGQVAQRMAMLSGLLSELGS
jgi:glutamate carboxypeptidase